MPLNTAPFVRSTLAGLTTVFLLGACAPIARPIVENTAGEEVVREKGKECFFVRQITGYRNAPDSADGAARIYVDVGASDTYLFETFGSCPDLNWAQGIGFDVAGTSRICDGIDVDLIVPGTFIGPRRCPVRLVRKLAEDELGSR